MTSAFTTRRLALLATLASSLWLAACGGGGSGGGGGGNSSVRAINLTTDLASADVFTGDTRQFAALAKDQLAPAVSIGAETYTVNVKSAGNAATLFTGSYSLAKDNSYVAVLWGRQAALRVSTIGESEDTANIATGNTRVRVFNATIDSGTVDVYITLPTVDLNDVPPTRSALTTGALAGFSELSAGTYRIRVTGPGDPNDVRLDIPAIALSDKKFSTLVLTQSGDGGVLLNGTLITQGGDKVTAKNTKARVRLAASVANSGVVSASVDGTEIFSSYRSPRVLGTGGYAQVEVGAGGVARPVKVTVTNAAACGAPTNVCPSATLNTVLDAGGDYTVLAYGTDSTPKVAVLTDDNRLPSTTTRAKLRIVNGLPGADLLSVLLDSQSFAQTSDIAGGLSSTYASVTALGSSTIQVYSSEKSDALVTQTVAGSNTSLLQAGGVYTMFVLTGGTNPVEVGRLTKDR